LEKISSNVYVETGFRGSNDGFIVTTEGIVMIDSPQFAVDALNWRDMVVKYGEVKYIINTEPHIDHVFGSFYFKGTVIGHEGIRQTLLAADSEQVKQSRKGTEDYTMMNGWHFRPPTITFSRDLTLYIGKHTFKLINMPGHTPYQTAIFIPEEKVVFTSDNLVYKTPPFMTEACSAPHLVKG
jgi:cyclase